MRLILWFHPNVVITTQLARLVRYHPLNIWKTSNDLQWTFTINSTGLRLQDLAAYCLANFMLAAAAGAIGILQLMRNLWFSQFIIIIIVHQLIYSHIDFPNNEYNFVSIYIIYYTNRRNSYFSKYTRYRVVGL